MGRSRGGLTTKIHALVDADGRPIRVKLTAGQAHDGRSAADMFEIIGSGQILSADRAYDSDRLRQDLKTRGAWGCIRPMPNRVNIPASVHGFTNKGMQSSGSSINSNTFSHPSSLLQCVSGSDLMSRSPRASGKAGMVHCRNNLAGWDLEFDGVREPLLVSCFCMEVSVDEVLRRRTDFSQVLAKTSSSRFGDDQTLRNLFRDCHTLPSYLSLQSPIAVAAMVVFESFRRVAADDDIPIF